MLTRDDSIDDRQGIDDERHQSAEADEAIPRPGRNRRGQFARGSNHNPKGRPKKVAPPTSMGEAVARALRESVSVTIKGKSTKMPTYEALARKIVTLLVAASPSDLSRLFRMLEKLDVFNELKHQETLEANEQNGNAWTPELEAKFQLLGAELYSSEEEDSLPEPINPSDFNNNDWDRGGFSSRSMRSG